MKKLALILALAMSCNLFTAMNVSAATGEAPTLNIFYDFENMTSKLDSDGRKLWSKDEPTAPEGAPAGTGFINLIGDSNDNNVYINAKKKITTGYTISKDNGTSWGVTKQGKFKYDFGGKILGTATVSFDYLKIGEAVYPTYKGGRFEIAVNDAEWHGSDETEGTRDWDQPLMSFVDQKIYDRNSSLYATTSSNTLMKEITYGEWQNIKFVIHGTENSVSIERWINGERVDRKDENGNFIAWTGSNEVGISAISFFGQPAETNTSATYYVTPGSEAKTGAWGTFIDNFEVTYRNSTDGSATTATAKASEKYMVSTGDAIVITLSSPVDPETVPAQYIISGTSNYDNTPISSIANAALSNNNRTITLTGMNGYATYTSLLPEGILGASGEEIVMNTESVWFNDVENDHFEDFEGYIADQKMRGLRTGSASNKYAQSDASVIGETYGKSLNCTGKGLQYFLNGNVDTGKYVFSYDVYDEGTSSNNSATHSMGIKYNFKNNETFDQTGTAITGYVIDQNRKIQIQGNNTNFVKSGEQDYLFPQDQWVHIDVVLEYPAEGEPVQTLYVNGEQLHSDTLNTTLKNVAYTKAKGYKFAAFFLDQGNNRQYHIDNVHRREFGETAAAFELNADKTGGCLTFEDAVDLDTLTEENILILDAKGQLEEGVAFSLSNKSIYGADITFTSGAITDGGEYIVILDVDGDYVSDVKNSAGEALPTYVEFSTVESFEITDIKVFNSNSVVTNAALWDDEAAQSYEITVNSNVSAKNASIIAAGYDGEGILTGVVIDDVSLADGKVTGAFDALDMDGAETIKLFVIDMTNMSPYLLTPVTL